MVGPQTMWPLFGWIPRGIRKVVGHWVLHSEVRWSWCWPWGMPRTSATIRSNGWANSSFAFAHDWISWLGPGWPRVVGKAPQLELEMTVLPKQQQPGWLRLQLDVR